MSHEHDEITQGTWEGPREESFRRSPRDPAKAKKSEAQPGLEDLGSQFSLDFRVGPCAQLRRQLSPGYTRWVPRNPAPGPQRCGSIQPRLPGAPRKVRQGPGPGTPPPARAPPSVRSSIWPSKWVHPWARSLTRVLSEFLRRRPPFPQSSPLAGIFPRITVHPGLHPGLVSRGLANFAARPNNVNFPHTLPAPGIVFPQWCQA
jgi:hypothetical protein